jgi:hypothetical protein
LEKSKRAISVMEEVKQDDFIMENNDDYHGDQMSTSMWDQTGTDD